MKRSVSFLWPTVKPYAKAIGEHLAQQTEVTFKFATA